MKTYTGNRAREVGHACCTAVIVAEDGKRCRILNPRHDLANHSPDGFEWGYLGSGPAQLALALCADVLGTDAAALKVYQDVKQRLVSRIVGDTFRLTEDQVVGAIEAVREKANG